MGIIQIGRLGIVSFGKWKFDNDLLSILCDEVEYLSLCLVLYALIHCSPSRIDQETTSVKTTSLQALKQTNSKHAILKLVQHAKGDYMDKGEMSAYHVTPIKVVLTDLAHCIITISVNISFHKISFKN